MPWEMSCDEKQKTLYITTHGIMTLKDATIMRNEGAAIIKQNGLTRCLLDHSNLDEYVLQTFDIYNLPNRYRELEISHGIKLAVVVHEKLKENIQFYENVCRNNGYQVSMFFSQGEAKAWLGEEMVD